MKIKCKDIVTNIIKMKLFIFNQLEQETKQQWFRVSLDQIITNCVLEEHLNIKFV